MILVMTTRLLGNDCQKLTVSKIDHTFLEEDRRGSFLVSQSNEHESLGEKLANVIHLNVPLI